MVNLRMVAAMEDVKLVWRTFEELDPRTLYALLGQFDAATKKHVHLENNILFPKALRLEEALANPA